MPPKENDVRATDVKALHARIKDLEERMMGELDKKKDRDVVDVEISNLKESIGQPHQCVKEAQIATLSQSMSGIEDGIKDINHSLNRWRSFKFGGVIALVLAIVSGAAYMVRASSKTDTVERSVQKIETDVSQMKVSHKNLEVQLVEMKADREEGSEEDLEQIRVILREELQGVTLPKTKKKGKGK